LKERKEPQKERKGKKGEERRRKERKENPTTHMGIKRGSIFSQHNREKEVFYIAILH
jgi:hypothetical protein